MRGVAPGKIGQFSAHWAYVDRPSQAKEEEEVVELSKVFFFPFVHVVPLQPHLTIFFYIPFFGGGYRPRLECFSNCIFSISGRKKWGGLQKVHRIVDMQYGGSTTSSSSCTFQ
jgi:hypothetical protein